MGDFDYMTEESYQLLKNMHQTKEIDDKMFIELANTRNIKQLEEVFKKNYNISTQEQITKIWFNFINKWKWDRDDKENCTVFNEWQSIFIKKLLCNGGVYTKEQCQREILTEFQTYSQLVQLERNNIIFHLKSKRLFGNRIVYILNKKVAFEN